MGTLATIDDYYAFRGEPVPTLSEAEETLLTAKLTRASNRVRYALRLASYTRAADGLPASSSQRQALRDAVSAEYDAISASGDDLTGAAPVYDDVQALGVRFTRRGGAAAGWSPLVSLSPEARLILVEAGFFSTAVEH